LNPPASSPSLSFSLFSFSDHDDFVHDILLFFSLWKAGLSELGLLGYLNMGVGLHHAMDTFAPFKGVIHTIFSFLFLLWGESMALTTGFWQDCQCFVSFFFSR
jgi:hypothetical protein